MSKLLPFLNVRHSNIMIMGDFNFDLQTGNDNFFKFMEETFSCRQDVSKVTGNYGSMLDLIFIKVNSEVHIETDVHVAEAYWSDHKVVYAAVDFSFSIFLVRRYCLQNIQNWLLQ